MTADKRVTLQKTQNTGVQLDGCTTVDTDSITQGAEGGSMFMIQSTDFLSGSGVGFCHCTWFPQACGGSVCISFASQRYREN